MVADVLEQTWNVLSNEDLEKSRGIKLNFLEYMAITRELDILKEMLSKTLLIWEKCLSGYI